MGVRNRRLLLSISASLALLLFGPTLLGLGGAILGERFASLFFQSESSDSDYMSLAVKLMLENAHLREMAAKSRIYRAMLSYTRIPEVNAVVGRVMFRSEGLIRGDLIVDRGTGSSVNVGDVCITSRGLVGIVTETDSHSSTVKPVTNPAINVSCITAESGSLGILTSDADGQLRLEYVDRASEPVTGETILTSRFGGVYPEGIVVGNVTYIEESSSGYDLTLGVDAAVDFDRVDEVLILRSQGGSL